MRLKVFLSSFLTFITLFSFAQVDKTIVMGKVVESNGQQPIEFATVALIDSATQQILDGTTTNEEGKFLLPTSSSGFYVEVSFLGFIPKTIGEYKIVEGKIRLGIVSLDENSEILDEVEVETERSYTTFKLDKRVFNVGKDLSNTGASALEVLDNVPSVNVNVEGEISLRGVAGVQVLINGKPSVLADQDGNALGSITADMIERIEVITNPSAKYDAEGTSGIINIVLKKEERKGTNGSFTINTGYPHNHSFGLSLNHRTEKFNFFGQAGAGYRALPSDKDYVNQDLTNDTIISSTGFEDRNEGFVNIILGMDYYINPSNTITFSGSFAYEIERQPSLANFSAFRPFSPFSDSSILYSQWYREETTEATNLKWQYEAKYQKQFNNDEDHTLQLSAISHFFGKDQSSEFDNISTDGSFEDFFQRTRTDFKEARYTFNADYVHPFNETWTLEAGSQLAMSFVSNDYEVTDLINNEWVIDTTQANIFDFDQHVLGVYGTGAYEKNKWGVKLGLRLEHTIVNTLFRNNNEENDQRYTNLFPSGHISYKFTDAISIQAGYSRRIRRPRMWDLNPFFNIRNNFNIRTGNPDLQPEFTDSYELNSIFIFKKLSFNFGVYYRYTTDVIERISFFENNVNTITPLNIGVNHAPGAELNAKYTPLKWLSFNYDFNINYFKRIGSFSDQSFDFDAYQWSTKVNAKFKLPLNFDLETTFNYRSKYKVVQGEIAENVGVDLGVRKKILKGKAILNLSIRDVFATRVSLVETFQPDFYTSNRSQRGRFMTFGFSYGFGKGEAMEFYGRRRM